MHASLSFSTFDVFNTFQLFDFDRHDRYLSFLHHTYRLLFRCVSVLCEGKVHHLRDPLHTLFLYFCCCFIGLVSDIADDLGVSSSVSCKLSSDREEEILESSSSTSSVD